MASLLCGIFTYNFNSCLWDQCRKIYQSHGSYDTTCMGYVILQLRKPPMLESKQHQLLRSQNSGIRFQGDVFCRCKDTIQWVQFMAPFFQMHLVYIAMRCDEKPTSCSWTPYVTCPNCFFLSQKFYSFMQHLLFHLSINWQHFRFQHISPPLSLQFPRASKKNNKT